MESESIHVPASTVRRVVPIVKWIFSLLSIGITAAAGFGARWVISRTSVSEVSPLIAKVSEQAAAAQSAAHHSASVADDQAAQIEQMTALLLDVWAQAEVDRAYSKSPRRNEYIESARKFYSRTYRELRDTHTPARALELTHATEWRPDR